MGGSTIAREARFSFFLAAESKFGEYEQSVVGGIGCDFGTLPSVTLCQSVEASESDKVDERMVRRVGRSTFVGVAKTAGRCNGRRNERAWVITNGGERKGRKEAKWNGRGKWPFGRCGGNPAKHRDLIRLARDSYVGGVILLNADCHYDLLQVVMH